MSSAYRALDNAAGDVVAVKLLNTMHPDEIRGGIIQERSECIEEAETSE